MKRRTELIARDVRICAIAWIVLLGILYVAPLNSRAGESSVRTSQSAQEIEDIGAIEAAEGEGTASRLKFRASVATRADYTSNAKLSGNHGSGDVLFLPTVELGLNAPLGHGFSFDVAVKLEAAAYSRFDERGFIGYSAVTTLDWRPKPNLPRIYIGAEPYRYDSFDTGDLLTQALGLTAGTDWGFAFNGGNSLAFIGYSFTDYLADPNIDDRFSHRGTVGLVHQFKPQLYGQAYYQYQYTDFQEVDRRDSRHIFGVSLTYQINRRLFTSLTGSFVDNDSTQNLASYQSAGASLGLTWQF